MANCNLLEYELIKNEQDAWFWIVIWIMNRESLGQPFNWKCKHVNCSRQCLKFWKRKMRGWSSQGPHGQIDRLGEQQEETGSEDERRDQGSWHEWQVRKDRWPECIMQDQRMARIQKNFECIFSPFNLSLRIQGLRYLLGHRFSACYVLKVAPQRGEGRKGREYKFQNKAHGTFDPRNASTPVCQWWLSIRIYCRCRSRRRTRHWWCR